MREQRPPLPPFTFETAVEKVRKVSRAAFRGSLFVDGEGARNSRN
jgi:nuclear transport factor 2 (NTF2) superfamily protein